MAKFFEAGNTYIENAPYRAPEITSVFKVEWVGHVPDTGNVLAFGFITAVYPGDEWQAQLMAQTSIAEEKFPETWVEAVYDTSTDTPQWRPMTPADTQ